MGTDNIEIFFTEIDALANIDLQTRQIKSTHKQLNIIRIGTSGSLQEDIKLGSHLVSDYAVGLDTLMHFYNLPQSELENEIVAHIQQDTGMLFTPYIARGSQSLKATIGDGMISGNTVTCPGFYAPQGRRIRLDLKQPQLINDLNCFNHDGFWLTNFEMETAGYYALAKLLGHEMLSVNAIIANRITNKFSDDPNKVVDDLILKVLNQV
jgi:uridine phosphorylase